MKIADKLRKIAKFCDRPSFRESANYRRIIDACKEQAWNGMTQAHFTYASIGDFKWEEAEDTFNQDGFTVERYMNGFNLHWYKVSKD